jgi:Na+/proline symporter
MPGSGAGEVRSDQRRPVRRRPGRLWLFFWGKKRRGFPGLLVGLLVVALGLALLFRLPGGPQLSRYAGLLTIAVLIILILTSLVLVVVAAIRPPRRGRR